MLKGDLLFVDDVFEKTIVEITADFPVAVPFLHSFTSSLVQPGFQFAEHQDGVVLLTPQGDVAGVYLGPDVAIAPRFRGFGLGSELIAERALRDDELPGWSLDDPCYTTAGEIAHRAAWRLLADPIFSSAKIDAIRNAHASFAHRISPGPGRRVELENRL
jgi:GNAT superfamily N-acetyltransferase